MAEMTRDGVLEMLDDGSINEVIARLEQIGEAYRTPLFRAAHAGELGFLAATDGQPVPSRYLKMKRPTLVMLAGDNLADQGPDSWPEARKLILWAQSCIIHATSGQTHHYEAAVLGTRMHKQVLMIECQYRHHAAWLALIQRLRPRMPVLNIVPPAGGQHPVAPPRERMN